MARWETLFLVAFSDHALTQGELAKLISVEGPTLVRMLDVLAKEGLIERKQSEIDRRVTTNAITPAGRQAIDDIMSVTNALRAEVLMGIDPADLKIAVKVLGQIIERIDEMR
ncbi:MAG: MarR family transcriptional regulator [Caulobacteraceae bacterium]